MPSDVEMSGSPASSSRLSVTDVPPPSPPRPTSQSRSASPSTDNLSDGAPHHSISTSNGTPHPTGSSTSNGDIKRGDNTAPLSKGKKPKASTSGASAAKPASTATSAKPKSTKAPAARSPSPSPPPPSRPPLQTIRLDIKLGGPEDYEVDISALSKDTGQRPPTPVPVLKRDSTDDSHSEGDDEGDGKLKDKVKDKEKKRKRKKNLASEYYDTTDPFIDDSELAQDERTFFAQTKQKGFYVSSGQVALLNKTPKKPKSKKANILAPSASVSAALSAAALPPSLASTSTARPASPSKKATHEDGSRDSPIALYSDSEDKKADAGPGLKRKLSEEGSIDMNAMNGNGSANGSVAGDGTKKKRKVEIHPFHPDLEKDLEVLREAIAKENWESKGKFPPSLKPVLAKVALRAVVLGEYDDNFFNLMPRLFPYNKFTMTKLIKRTIWREHTNLLVERQAEILKQLQEVATAGFPKAQDEWEKSVHAWEKRQERSKAGGAPDGAGHSLEGTPVAESETRGGSPPPAEAGNETGMDVDHDEKGKDKDKDGEKGDGGKEPHPPAKKYRLTNEMKELIWQLVCLSNECCRIENEKNSLEGSTAVVSDQGVRKSLYQKIVAAFPDGWLSSGQISREVSVMKKKYEKEVAENEA